MRERSRLAACVRRLDPRNWQPRNWRRDAISDPFGALAAALYLRVFPTGALVGAGIAVIASPFGIEALYPLAAVAYVALVTTLLLPFGWFLWALVGQPFWDALVGVAKAQQRGGVRTVHQAARQFLDQDAFAPAQPGRVQIHGPTGTEDLGDTGPQDLGYPATYRVVQRVGRKRCPRCHAFAYEPFPQSCRWCEKDLSRTPLWPL